MIDAGKRTNFFFEKQSKKRGRRLSRRSDAPRGTNIQKSSCSCFYSPLPRHQHAQPPAPAAHKPRSHAARAAPAGSRLTSASTAGAAPGRRTSTSRSASNAPLRRAAAPRRTAGPGTRWRARASARRLRRAAGCANPGRKVSQHRAAASTPSKWGSSLATHSNTSGAAIRLTHRLVHALGQAGGGAAGGQHVPRAVFLGAGMGALDAAPSRPCGRPAPRHARVAAASTRGTTPGAPPGSPGGRAGSRRSARGPDIIHAACESTQPRRDRTPGICTATESDSLQRHGRKPRVPVLLPYPFRRPVRLRRSRRHDLAPGDIVLVPLNRRQEMGVVWDAPSGPAVDDRKLKPVSARIDAPPMSAAVAAADRLDRRLHAVRARGGAGHGAAGQRAERCRRRRSAGRPVREAPARA